MRGKWGKALPPYPRHLTQMRVAGSALLHSCPWGWFTYNPTTGTLFGQGTGPALPSVVTSERWDQLSKVPHPVMLVLHSPWTSTWSPSGCPTRDTTMFSSGNKSHGHQPLLLCSHKPRHDPQTLRGKLGLTMVGMAIHNGLLLSNLKSLVPPLFIMLMWLHFSFSPI